MFKFNAEYRENESSSLKEKYIPQAKEPDPSKCNIVYIRDPSLTPLNPDVDAWEKTIRADASTHEVNRLQKKIDWELMKIIPAKETFRPNPAAGPSHSKLTFLQQVLSQKHEDEKLCLQAAQWWKPAPATL